jgi:hypothetical protein
MWRGRIAERYLYDKSQQDCSMEVIYNTYCLVYWPTLSSMKHVDVFVFRIAEWSALSCRLKYIGTV